MRVHDLIILYDLKYTTETHATLWPELHGVSKYDILLSNESYNKERTIYYMYCAKWSFKKIKAVTWCKARRFTDEMSDNKVYIPFIVFFFNSINDYPVKKNPNPDTTVINAKWSFFSWACATYKCRTIKAWGQICQTSIPQPNRICKPMY